MKAAGGGLKDGGFVVPADVVSHLGNGSTDAGLAALQKRHNARPIRGAGDGMSDSIKTTIDGRHPARVADGEAYIPPEQVKRSGGAKKFYAMMDKVRKERTGSKKQGKKINPNKYMTA
jgi:actin-like ATPase involved in cell morphogenesis